MRVLATPQTIPGSCAEDHRRSGDAGRLRAPDHANLQATYAYVTSVSNVRSSLTPRGGTHPHQLGRRSGTVALELQAGYKFGLAMMVGLGAILGGLPTSGAALVLIVAVLVAGRALAVLAAGGDGTRAVRPRTEADWDAGLAATWAALALALAVAGSVAGVAVAGAGAIALAFLRLRTRYVL